METEIDIDDEVLVLAASELGTTNEQDTVNAALEFVAQRRERIEQLLNGTVEFDPTQATLTNRSVPTLRLSNAADTESETRTLEALSQLLALSIDDEMLGRIASRLSITFPWADLLPAHVRPDFVSEFLNVARACLAVGRFDRLTIILEAWKSTAEAYADPAVAINASDLHHFDAPEVVPDPRTGE